jgi:hypothetical protein
MRFLLFICLFILISCSHQRGPASDTSQPVATDSMALGNVKAFATKTTDNKNVCFDISLSMKGVDQKDASPSNWTVAWIDKESKYHLLSLNQRDPASIPQGGTKIAPYGYYQEWKNNFRACAPKAVMGDVEALSLTPKSLPYKEAEGLTLKWK